MSARMGIYQETVYAKYGKHPAEALFYNVTNRYYAPLYAICFYVDLSEYPIIKNYYVVKTLILLLFCLQLFDHMLKLISFTWSLSLDVFISSLHVHLHTLQSVLL